MLLAVPMQQQSCGQCRQQCQQSCGPQVRWLYSLYQEGYGIWLTIVKLLFPAHLRAAVQQPVCARLPSARCEFSFFVYLKMKMRYWMCFTDLTKTWDSSFSNAVDAYIGQNKIYPPTFFILPLFFMLFGLTSSELYLPSSTLFFQPIIMTQPQQQCNQCQQRCASSCSTPVCIQQCMPRCGGQCQMNSKEFFLLFLPKFSLPFSLVVSSVIKLDAYRGSLLAS